MCRVRVCVSCVSNLARISRFSRFQGFEILGWIQHTDRHRHRKKLLFRIKIALPDIVRSIFFSILHHFCCSYACFLFCSGSCLCLVVPVAMYSLFFFPSFYYFIVVSFTRLPFIIVAYSLRIAYYS